MKKRITYLALMICIMISICACSKKENNGSGEAPVGMANPVHETDEQGLLENTGFDIKLPEMASNISYKYIDGVDGDKLAEVDFEWDGHSYYYRIKYTDLIRLSDDSENKDADYSKSDISGLYYEWDEQSNVKISYCDGVFLGNTAENVSVLMWIDIVPGVLYNLCSTDMSDASVLAEVANSIFVSVQGES